MKQLSPTGWVLFVLFVVQLAGHVQQPPGIATSDASLQTVSCDGGQSCILLRDWARPWMADLLDRPVRHLESKEQTSQSERISASLDRVAILFYWQPDTALRVPTLAEAVLALLYPFHELG